MDRDYDAVVGMMTGFFRGRILLLEIFCYLSTNFLVSIPMRKEMLRHLLTETSISVHNFYVESDVAAWIALGSTNTSGRC